VTFQIIYHESNELVKTVEIDAECLFEAEEKFKAAYPDAVYWEIGVEIGADLALDDASKPSLPR
jgi:hypothetical protein